MNKVITLIKKIKHLWPAGILISVVLALGFINYKPDTLLTGWDNLHPEFNLGVNIQRSVFAVWQEYQGLGLLGGMGHASDLVRQLFLALLNPFVPMHSLRYAWTIGTLLIGTLGTYVFIKSLLIPYQNGKKDIYAAIGALFYLLNLATLQTYFVAFEAFINHYAFLPWLLWACISYVRTNSKKQLIILTLIALIATPSAYIPTLFVAFLIALFILLFGLFIFSNTRIELIKKSVKMLSVIFIVNAFWLLPFLYFTLTSANITVDSKMNQMATDTIFSQNKEFGTLQDTILLKGFWFNNVDPDMEGNFRHMLSSLRSHLSNPLIVGIGVTLFSVIILGVINALTKRRPFHLAVLLLFIFSFAMLCVDTPPFSWAVSVFRELPLFGQAFRFPFTKFSILAAFSYSLMFTLGVEFIVNLLKRFHQKIVLLIVGLAAAILMGIFTLPAFTGSLFYEKEQVALPQEYIQTFEFFNKQDPNTRVANFPQHTYWGWNFYEWGYGGSGFLWYGIKQPILDRAFDVWSPTLENYYFELSTALYSNDNEKLFAVLNKYQVNWLLVDKNVYSPFSPKSLHFDQIDLFLSENPNISKSAQYGKIAIYKVKLNDNPKNYLFSTPSLPQSNSYTWGLDDTTYQATGNYIEGENLNTIVPFRSLSSARLQKDNEYIVTEDNKSITISNTLPAITKSMTLTLPSYTQSELIMPVEVSKKTTDGLIEISVRPLYPVIKLGETTLTQNGESFPLFVMNQEAEGTYTITLNGRILEDKTSSQDETYTAYISLTQPNYLTVRDTQTGQAQNAEISSEYIKELVDNLDTSYEITAKDSKKKISITLPIVNDGNLGHHFKSGDFKNSPNCNSFRNGTVSFSVTPEDTDRALNLYSENNTACTVVYTPTLSHNNGYIMLAKSTNTAGRPLHVWIENTDQRYSFIDTYLPTGNASSSIIIPPMEDFGQGYSFHFENISIGKEKVQNELKDVKVFQIPYEFIAHMTIASPLDSSQNSLTFESSHPNESLYVLKNISAQNENPATLILSQSYHSGWTAYSMNEPSSPILEFFQNAVPFIAGEEITTHSKVNNWENGWVIEKPHNLKGGKIVIVFMPQYLQYLGFLLLGGFITLLFVKPLLGGFIRSVKETNSFFEKQSATMKNKIHLTLHSTTL